MRPTSRSPSKMSKSSNCRRLLEMLARRRRTRVVVIGTTGSRNGGRERDVEHNVGGQEGQEREHGVERQLGEAGQHGVSPGAIGLETRASCMGIGRPPVTCITVKSWP